MSMVMRRTSSGKGFDASRRARSASRTASGLSIADPSLTSYIQIRLIITDWGLAMTAPAHSVATDFGLGPIDQISFAVKSVDAAVPAYEALFGSQFTVRDVALQPDLVSYKGAPADAALRLAFGATAGIEVELVEVLRGPAPARDHREQHDEGLHHVRFSVADITAKIAQLEGAGFTVVFGGRTPRGSQFAYLEAP